MLMDQMTALKTQAGRGGFWWAPSLLVTPPRFNIAPAKMMVGRLLSFWNSKFSGAMLNFQGVSVIKWSYVINPPGN